MKHYHILHDGLVYYVDVYATSKREAIAQYRKQWRLERKRINLVCICID